jgi:hypothetical protein
MRFTHMLQLHVPNVSSIFRRMSHSSVFHVASVSCCRPMASRGRADWAHDVPRGRRTRAPGRADSGATIGARWGHARPQLLIPAHECRTREERGRGQGRPASAQIGRSACVGQGEGVQGRGEGGRGRAARAYERTRPSGRPDASHTPFINYSFSKKFINYLCNIFPLELL